MITLILIVSYIITVFLCRWLNILCYKLDNKIVLANWLWLSPGLNIVCIMVLFLLYIENKVRDSKFWDWFTYKNK
jgi:hypothetical protein